MEEILPRLYRIVVPLPQNPLKEINSYIFTSDDRNLIVDTGMNRIECSEVLEAGLAEIGVDLERTDFIATHLHSDHQGLIPTLKRAGSAAYMGELDAVQMASGSEFGSSRSPMGTYARRSGFPADELEASLRDHPGYRYGPGADVDYIPLRGDEEFKVGDYTLVAVATPGHTYGHMCLYEPHKKMLLSGDHVLGDITPNIQAWSDDQDPLAQYVESLEQVTKLEVELCLPGHRSLIRDFPGRVAELIEHHRLRANEVLDVLEGGGQKDAYQTASEMSWRIRARSWADFPVMQKWFAVGEAIAHLRYLEGHGLVDREERDGQIFYSTDGGRRL
ncbi:MAG: MBL fold metallo-hydrolase [Myxococcota bacterium]